MRSERSVQGRARPERANGLELAVNIAILLVAVVSVSGWSWYFWQVNRPSVRPAPSPQYAVGDDVRDVPEISRLARRPTLLIFVNSNCRFCTESMPFYRRLLGEHQDSSSTINVVVVGRESTDVLRDYLAIHGIVDTQVVSVAAGSGFKQTLTPSLILLDGEKRVIREWVGKLGKADETTVVSLVR